MMKQMFLEWVVLASQIDCKANLYSKYVRMLIKGLYNGFNSY